LRLGGGLDLGKLAEPNPAPPPLALLRAPRPQGAQLGRGTPGAVGGVPALHPGLRAGEPAPRLSRAPAAPLRTVAPAAGSACSWLRGRHRGPEKGPRRI